MDSSRPGSSSAASSGPSATSEPSSSRAAASPGGAASSSGAASSVDAASSGGAASSVDAASSGGAASSGSASVSGSSSALEAEPAVAASLFGDTIDQGRAFAASLAAHGEELGLIGPLELPRLWTRHILNSVLVAPLLEARGRVGDIGSGAGLPGLVLAIARPDVSFTLIEPMERRVDWLTAEAERLGLTNVSVLRARAEDVADDVVLDQVTARAVSALSKLIPIAVPLVRSGGQLILMKGARVDAEVEAARKVILRKRLTDVEVLELGLGTVEETTRVFRATVD